MSAVPSCGHGDLILALTMELRRTRAELESWQLVSIATTRHNAELTRELDMLSRRERKICERLREERDLWLDQADLRRADDAGRAA